MADVEVYAEEGGASSSTGEEARRHTPPPRHIGRLAWGRSGWCWWVKYRRLQISVLFWPR
jgi:hypothetical protein